MTWSFKCINNLQIYNLYAGDLKANPHIVRCCGKEISITYTSMSWCVQGRSLGSKRSSRKWSKSHGEAEAQCFHCPFHFGEWVCQRRWLNSFHGLLASRKCQHGLTSFVASKPFQAALWVRMLVPGSLPIGNWKPNYFVIYICTCLIPLNILYFLVSPLLFLSLLGWLWIAGAVWAWTYMAMKVAIKAARCWVAFRIRYHVDLQIHAEKK